MNDHRAPFRLDGKIAVVTGGGSGIGRAIAQSFASSGASVQVLDLDLDRSRETAHSITQTGGCARGHQCNVTDLGQVRQAFEEISGQGPIHILVNSAGVAHIGRLETTTAEEFERVFRVNVQGVFHCMQVALPRLRSAGGGVILNLASIAAFAGLSDRFAYSMSKGAVVAMTYSVARDYLGDKIRCNCISPARVHTAFVDGFLRQNYPGKEKDAFDRLSRQQPIGRMAEAEEVAALALYLCSDESSFVTGTNYPLDGGFLNLHG